MKYIDEFDQYLQESLKDPLNKKEYDKLDVEFKVIEAFLNARKLRDMTQVDVSRKSGVSQSDISKLERGKSNPTIKMLERLAESMDMHIEIQFVPNATK